MKKLGIILIIGVLMLSIVGLSGCFGSTEGTDFKSLDVYITDAPFGKYWVHNYGETHGGFLYFHGYTNSNLLESYTIKYIYEGELKTIIIKSTDTRLHVILTDDNSSMKLDVSYNWKEIYEGGAGPRDIFQFINYEPNDGESIYVWPYYDEKGNQYRLIMDYTFILYIPKPEICKISDEVIE